MRRLGDEQGEHRLMAAMDAVEVADRERAARRERGMVRAAKDAHGRQLSARGFSSSACSVGVRAGATIR